MPSSFIEICHPVIHLQNISGRQNSPLLEEVLCCRNTLNDLSEENLKLKNVLSDRIRETVDQDQLHSLDDFQSDMLKLDEMIRLFKGEVYILEDMVNSVEEADHDLHRRLKGLRSNLNFFRDKISRNEVKLNSLQQ